MSAARSDEVLGDEGVAVEESAAGVPPLEIVTVTYGKPQMVAACLRSAIEHAPAGTVIRVVDNRSPDDTPDMIEADFPGVLLTRSPSNDGFAVANNLALREVAAPYVLVLNPDTELAPGVLEHLVDLMEDEQDIGVLGCRLVTASGELDHAAKRMIPSPLTAARYFLLKAFRRQGSDYVAPHVGEFEMGDVDAVNGAFMLVRSSAMREVGGLDETYWMYAEDLDWCVRFRQAEWRVVYDGRVTATHLKAGSSGTSRSPRLNYHFHRSMAIFYRRRASSGHALVDLAVVAGIWLRFAVVTVADGVRRGRDRLRVRTA